MPFPTILIVKQLDKLEFDEGEGFMGLLEKIFLKTASDKKLAEKREKIRVKRNHSYDEKI